jgi:hypothetical protein
LFQKNIHLPGVRNNRKLAPVVTLKTPPGCNAGATTNSNAAKVWTVDSSNLLINSIFEVDGEAFTEEDIEIQRDLFEALKHRTFNVPQETPTKCLFERTESRAFNAANLTSFRREVLNVDTNEVDVEHDSAAQERGFELFGFIGENHHNVRRVLAHSAKEKKQNKAALLDHKRPLQLLSVSKSAKKQATKKGRCR